MRDPARRVAVVIDLTKDDIAGMLLDLKACEVAVTRFKTRKLTPRSYWNRREYGCAWLSGSPAADRYTPRMSYEEAIETLAAEWLVRTQCPDYWKGWQHPDPTNDFVGGEPR